MQYDIIIIGGGMVGASLACALKNSSYRIALIDAAGHSAHEDHRLLALSYSSCTLLKQIGIWSEINTYVTPIKQLHVSHQGHFGITRFQATEIGVDSLGHLAPAKHINHALEKKLSDCPNIHLIRPATLTDLTQHNEYVELTVTTAKETISLQTPCVIGADGTHSTVRNLLNIATEVTDYEQSALVTTTQLARDHQYIAYERFLKNGAIAMIPYLEKQCATIITADNHEIQRLLALNNEAFLHYLQQQFGYRLGRFKSNSERRSYPLKLTLAKENQKEKVILIGNAAHTFHPIAAQGFNLALQEITELLELLKTQTPDTLSFTLQKQQKISTKISHSLTWLFSKNYLPLNISRQLGMIALDNCTYAKNYFIRQLTGKVYNENERQTTT